jgi:hypothetical protein
MDDKDFAELYDVAKDAGFFADTPRNVDRASPHPFGEYSHSHRSSEDDTPASRSGQEDRGSTHHDRGDHLSHASDIHSAHTYPFARPTHSEEESPSSDRGHNNEDETEEFVHVAIPSITELDKALTSTTGYSHSQRTCVIPSPPKGATKKKKKVIVRNPLDEMGVAKVVDASGVIVTQQALGSSSSTHTKQAQWRRRGAGGSNCAAEHSRLLEEVGARSSARLLRPAPRHGQRVAAGSCRACIRLRLVCFHSCGAILIVIHAQNASGK